MWERVGRVEERGAEVRGSGGKGLGEIEEGMEGDKGAGEGVGGRDEGEMEGEGDV